MESKKGSTIINTKWLNLKFNIKLSSKRGRKKKRDIKNINGDNMEKEKGAQDKYSDDNMRKKCKNIIV